MSDSDTLTRRRFLEVTALVGGGLVVGCQIGKNTGTESRAGGTARSARATGTAGVASETTFFAPNAWISIGRDGAITFICPRNEMGQDVHTSLAMLLAEELEVDPREVTVVQAPVDPAFTNSLLGGQLTGGSTSVRDAWDPLRRGGATARTLLVAAAAAQWNVPAAQCRAEGGAVLHPTHGSLRYAELAEAASRLPVPAADEVALKPASQFRVIGKPLPRLDGSDKARGRTRYGIDATLPGHAACGARTLPRDRRKGRLLRRREGEEPSGRSRRRRHRRGRRRRRGSLFHREVGPRRPRQSNGTKGRRPAWTRARSSPPSNMRRAPPAPSSARRAMRTRRSPAAWRSRRVIRRSSSRT